jgi:CRISPR/Cas system CMR-associated protein Cmr1 (group 7 of RAMP superfamily)
MVNSMTFNDYQIVILPIYYRQDEPQPTLEEINHKTAESINQWDQDFLNEVSLQDLYDLVIFKILKWKKNWKNSRRNFSFFSLD